MSYSLFPISSDSDFSIYNLPYGVYSTSEQGPRIGVALGDAILDLASLQKLGLFSDDRLPADIFSNTTLNDFISLGKEVWTSTRVALLELAKNESHLLWREADQFVILQSAATMHVPVAVGDYTDFYSSIEHATNVGKLFRDPDNALLPNWKHLPVGYHGRASSIVVSGTPITRPNGQTMPVGADKPVFGPSKRLDFELEMAFIVGRKTDLGDSIPVSEAEDHIFGMVLFNDWSARDIQKWEYVPLGPFLGKSFASSISPWIVTMDALTPFKVEGPTQDPEVHSYLQRQGAQNYNIQLEVGLTTADEATEIISTSNFKYMYWSMAQQLAHHTINGCNVNVGDMMASGTISGKDKSSYGSLLELSEGGKVPYQLKNGEKRTFIEDYDTITMSGYAQKGDIRVGFGHVSGTILPAKN